MFFGASSLPRYRFSVADRNTQTPTNRTKFWVFRKQLPKPWPILPVSSVKNSLSRPVLFTIDLSHFSGFSVFAATLDGFALRAGCQCEFCTRGNRQRGPKKLPNSTFLCQRLSVRVKRPHVTLVTPKSPLTPTAPRHSIISIFAPNAGFLGSRPPPQFTSSRHIKSPDLAH